MAICALIIFALTGCRAQKGMTARERVAESRGTEVVKGVSGVKDGIGKHNRELLAKEAESWIGTPYKYGCAEKGEGSDCSGMIVKVYEKVLGWKLPRNSAAQAEFCIPLDTDDVKAGDLVFFATGADPAKVTHVGIMEGDGKTFIHVSSSKGAVISWLTNPYYSKRILMFGRVPGMKD